jgi:hypothetical protein
VSDSADQIAAQTYAAAYPSPYHVPNAETLALIAQAARVGYALGYAAASH